MEDFGYKSVAVNYSDLASCGADPLYIMLGLSAPPEFLERHLEDFYRGITAALARWGGAFAGGDYTRSDRIVVTISATGILPGDGDFWSRSGCRTGEQLYLSGFPGKAHRDLQLFLSGTPPDSTCLTRPEPALDLSTWLRREGIPVGGCCDTSDSLVASLHLLSEMSGVGIEVERDTLAGFMDAGSEDAVFYGGEDFDLLFSSSADIDCSRLGTETGILLTRIGRIREGAGVVDNSGNPLRPGGYDHLKQASAPG